MQINNSDLPLFNKRSRNVEEGFWRIHFNKEVKTTMIEALSNFFGAIASALWGKKSNKEKVNK